MPPLDQIDSDQLELDDNGEVVSIVDEMSFVDHLEQLRWHILQLFNQGINYTLRFFIRLAGCQYYS